MAGFFSLFSKNSCKSAIAQASNLIEMRKRGLRVVTLAHLAESISIETRVYKLSHLEQISVPL